MPHLDLGQLCLAAILFGVGVVALYMGFKTPASELITTTPESEEASALIEAGFHDATAPY